MKGDKFFFWRTTKSTKCEEIADLIDALRERVGGHLDMIVVVDCCRVRNFYESTFPDTPVKLDNFHAVQRITKTIPKDDPCRQKVSREFPLVLRQDGDIDEDRMLETPAPEVILGNLEQFI